MTGKLDPELTVATDEVAPADLAAAASGDGAETVRRQQVDCWTLVLLIAAGALVVAGAYAMGRRHMAHAMAVYWLGQGLVLLPAAWACLSRWTDARSRVFSLTATAAAQSLLTWCYSPDQFRYPDELQHVVTTQTILSTHHLYATNLVLPVSSGFPGLEIATSGLMRLTGLSMFHAGLIIVSLCHIMLPVAVFMLFQQLTNNLRLAGAAAFVYTLAPHYSYFNTLFIYSVPAITFLVLVLNAAAGSWQRRSSPLWIVVAFTPLVITHHVTAVAALALLVGFAAVLALSGLPRRGLYLAATAVVLADDLIAWVEIHSPTTFAYLYVPISSSFSGLLHRSHKAASTVGVINPPKWEHYAGELSAVAMLGLVVLGIVLIWRHTHDWFFRLLSLLGLVYVGILGVRLGSSDGAELASRTLTYAMLVVAYPVAVALLWLLTSRFRTVSRATLAVTIPLLLVGAIVTGLPPSWERVPGTFRVDSLESGVDQHVTAVGNWAAATWSPGQRVACDLSACNAFGAYALASPSGSSALIMYDSTVTKLNKDLGKLAINFIETDSRTTTQVPATGSYFVPDTRTHAHPLAASLFTKFSQDPLLDLVYDDGDIRVYYSGRTY